MKIGLILRNLLVFIIFGTVLSSADNGDNGNCNKAEVVALPYTGNGSMSSSDKEDYYSFTPSSDGTVTITVSGANRDIDAYLYNSNCSSELSKDDSASNNPVITNFAVQAGQTYKLRLNYYPNKFSTNYNLNIAFTPTEIVNSNFPIRKTINLTGNMKIIGNTVLCPKNNAGQCVESGTNVSNADVNLRYTKLSSDNSIGSIFNSSSATLSDSAILSATAAKVKWAGLYWSGYLSDSTYTQTQANNLINNHTVKLSFAGGNYVDITSHTVLGRIVNGNYDGTSYGCFADVTSLMQGKDPRGEYKVANIPSTEGKTRDQNDGLGNSGAWTLVVIYENTSAGEKTRNATVFDGFIRVYDVDGNSNNGSQSANDININLSGFKTPKSGSVASALSVFANEGDRYIPSNNSNPGDQLIFTNLDGDKNGQTLILSSDSGANNYFDSSITGVDTRSPNIANNNGIDIHTDQLDSIMGTNQTKAQITLTTAQDTYFPVMVAFATELYMPKLCYDYSTRLNNELMQRGSSDRTFIPHKNDGIIEAKIFIRSLEGDFPYLNSNLKVSWTDVTNPASSNPPTFSFKNALVQRPGIYSYDPPSAYIDSTEGVYYIGLDRSGYHGVIDPYESLYAISNFESNNLSNSVIKVNAEVNASLALDENDPNSLTPFNFSTENGTLEVCPGSYIYNPMWYKFNVETAGAESGNYRLGTQVTGTDYNLKIVSYTKDANDKYTIKTPFTGGIEVEPFEVPSFQSLGVYDEDSYSFDRICEDSSNGKEWGNGKRLFSNFSNIDTVDLGVTANDNQYAMRNAGIRLWVLMADYDGDGVVSDITQDNDCANTDGNCFRNLYANDPYYKTVNTCDTACSSSSDEDCYKCLRANYSQPICSRDNFSVRPYGVELTARSMNTVIQRNDTVSSLVHNLISGLLGDYTIQMVAKSANSIDPMGYYFRRLSTEAKDIPNDSSFDSTLTDSIKEFFGLILDNTKINSGDISKCADSTHKRFDADSSNWKLENDNVGNYDVELIDKDWTIVDQARYQYKATVSKGFDDCRPNDTTLNISGLQGCDIQSFEVNNDSRFNKIPVKFVPAKINIQSLNYGSYPAHGNRWAYMNNLATNSAMGAQFAGDIVAINANTVPTPTSNFTANCFAQDVNFLNQYSTTQLDPNGDVIASNTDGTVLQGADRINLQQAYSFNNDNSFTAEDATILSTTEQTDEVNNDYRAQLTVQRENFIDANNGTLASDIRYNIKKLYYTAVNPIRMLFVKGKSQLLNDDGTPTTVWKSGYAPNTDPATVVINGIPVPDITFEIIDEKSTFSRDIALAIEQDILNNAFNFIYGRVYTPAESQTASTASGNHNIWLSAIMYLNNPAQIINLTPIIGTNPTMPLANWYTVQSHSQNANDGVIATLIDLNGGANINPAAGVLFDSPNARGVTSAIQIQYAAAPRPYVARVEVNPTVWLKYHPTKANGNPEFSVRFINSNTGDWAGTGNTGNVVNQPIGGNVKNRLNW
ncbi:exported hypothetical protein [Sulfurovum sp. enrichment culture clone C5]|uniref:Uncharacterized protein n=1 Tax=Sulfurovum sp. enrichment culture clone C5 TaxID=497650 RepID=A0A0S4XP26_9BACT|nr:exported hypothetical protein [Sulfurovum sp. enrichment culture clone C5]